MSALATVRRTVRERLARRLQVPEIPFALERLRDLGFRPSCVFDVGAYRGDFAATCRTIWPDAHIVCFEPLAAQVAALAELARRDGRMDVIEGLVGSTPRDGVVLHELETGSSILDEHFDQKASTSRHAMRTIDGVVAERYQNRPPEFLKLDVQGYELEVLKGAEKTLEHAQAILAEVSLLDIHVGVPLIAEVMAWLSEHDWVAYDICGLTRRPLDGALWQADLVFVPSESSLRGDKRWESKG